MRESHRHRPDSTESQGSFHMQGHRSSQYSRTLLEERRVEPFGLPQTYEQLRRNLTKCISNRAFGGQELRLTNETPGCCDHTKVEGDVFIIPSRQCGFLQ